MMTNMSLKYSMIFQQRSHKFKHRKYCGLSNNNIIENDPVLKAINKYEKHPSVLKIKE